MTEDAEPPVPEHVESVMRRRRRRGTVAALALSAAALIVALIEPWGSATTGLSDPPPPPLATSAEAQSFANSAFNALDRRFSATYEVTLYRWRGHTAHERVFVINWSQKRQLFRESPEFNVVSGKHYGSSYEVVLRPGGYVTCSAVRNSPWQCMSMVGSGMGVMSVVDRTVVPGALIDALGDAVGELSSSGTAPGPFFLSRARVDGRAVRCLSIGNAAGAVGRICTTQQGIIVSYRLQQQFDVGYYATAQLLSYATRVRLAQVLPPAKPVVPPA